MFGGGCGHGIRNCASRSHWAWAIHAHVSCWCCCATVMESNHCWFSLYGSPSISSIGWFNNTLDAWDTVSLPCLYCSHISLSNWRSLTQFGCNLCSTVLWYMDHHQYPLTNEGAELLTGYSSHQLSEQSWQVGFYNLERLLSVITEWCG